MKRRLSHACPPAQKGNLPFECLKAAETGNLDEIIKFLDNGGDINSGDPTGQTMLFCACNHGRYQVVSELLKRPEVHVNIVYKNVTPIFAAASNGHYECVKLLIEATQKCHANLRIRCEIKEAELPMSPIGLAAVGQHWKTFSLLLKATDAIVNYEIPDILYSAFLGEEWDIIREILKPDIGYQSPIFQKIIVKAYARHLDDVIHLVFQRSMNHDGNPTILIFPMEVFKAKDWDNLESLLKILDPTIKFDVPMAEALLKKHYKEVSQMLETKNYDSGTLNGILLLASLGGCSDEIADTLMSDVSRYSEEALKYTLLFASLYDRMYFVPRLLREKKFGYNILFTAFNLAEGQEMKNASQMLKLALAEKNCELFPKVAKSENMIQFMVSNGENNS